MSTAPPTPAGHGVPPADTRPQRIAIAGFLLVAIVGVLVVLYAWRLPPFSTPIVTTENALVRGQVTLIGTQLPGYVTAVKVQDFQHVKAGDLLVRLDDRIARQRVEQAQAQLAAQQAALAKWDQSHRGAHATVALNEAVQANAQAQAIRAQSTAAVANAEAALKAAQVDLDNTHITAPADGQLGRVTVRQGAYVNAGAQLMGLVPRQLWVVANLKETQMNNVRIGQSVTFRVDALEGAQMTGQVERISSATGSELAALPADNATGNYVKIAQRIPVRIRIDHGQGEAERLLPGMSVVVSIDTSSVP